jgi:predicted RNase H-like HicB family nuclease
LGYIGFSILGLAAGIGLYVVIRTEINRVVASTAPAELYCLHGVPMKYRIALHKSEEGYGVSVPGLPGCWSQGTTEDEAVENIRNAIREYLSVVDEQLRGEDVREVEIMV